MRSFAPQGMPCSGPRYRPAAISRSARSACLSARSSVSVTTQLSSSLYALQPRQIEFRQFDRRDLCVCSKARQLGDRHEGQVLVVGGPFGSDVFQWLHFIAANRHGSQLWRSSIKQNRWGNVVVNRHLAESVDLLVIALDRLGHCLAIVVGESRCPAIHSAWRTVSGVISPVVSAATAIAR